MDWSAEEEFLEDEYYANDDYLGSDGNLYEEDDSMSDWNDWNYGCDYEDF